MPNHAAAFQSDTSILNSSIQNIDNEWITPPTHVEFNGIICPPAIQASGLIDEIKAIDFFDKDKSDNDKFDSTKIDDAEIDSTEIDSTEMIDGNFFAIENDSEQLEHSTEPISDKNVESGKFKAFLQNLRKFHTRLATNDSNKFTVTANTTSTAADSDFLVQVPSCVGDGVGIESDVGLIRGNLFCNPNKRSEKRTPEDRLLEFSAEEFPSFEVVCKPRLAADKLTAQITPENNLTVNINQKNKTNNSMPNPNNLNITNVVTTNHEFKDTNVNSQKNTDNTENKDDTDNIDNIDNTEQEIAQNIKIINVTKNNEDNNDDNDDSMPLVLTLFKGDESLVGVECSGGGEVSTAEESSTELLISHDLEKSYFKSKLKIPVLNGVNFTAYSGEFVSITGQSGSGKSTLLHLLGTLDKPDAGEIIFDGRRVDNLSVSIRDKLRNSSIGFIFQFYNLLPEFTAIENVLSPLMIREGIFGYLMRRRVYIERAKELLERVGLLHRLRHKPSELSGGEIQRVAIARSLIIEPKLLLADEPTGNLDSASAKDVIRILRELKEERNLTIVMVTHDQSIASTADRVVKMSDGVINNL